MASRRRRIDVTSDMARGVSTGEILPVTATEFAALMRPFLPFEKRPVLAVAVSGGRDSRALALLAQQWARRRRGRAVALIVDHGLRPEAAAEADQTRAWLAALGIETHVLRWRPTVPPRTGIQAAARRARYRLLLEWCRLNGVLHLLTAHQADDQAETHTLRAARDSGPSGLAGMSAVVEYPQARLLRPLLTVPRRRLTATLAAGGHAWIDDPSNADPRFARARLRQQMSPRQAGMWERRSASLAARRIRAEGDVADALAACAMPHPLGAVLIDHAAWRGLSAMRGQQVLAAIVATVSGSDYPPRRERAARASAQMRVLPRRAPHLPSGLTLGGCRILWRGAGWLVVREPASIAANSRGEPPTRWDGRFDIVRKAGMPDTAFFQAATGMSGAWHRRWALAWPATPGLAVILAGLPAPGKATGVSWDLDVDGGATACAAPGAVQACFRPVRPLSPGPFFPCFASAKGQIVNDSQSACRRISPGAC